MRAVFAVAKPGVQAFRQAAASISSIAIFVRGLTSAWPNSVARLTSLATAATSASNWASNMVSSIIASAADGLQSAQVIITQLPSSASALAAGMQLIQAAFAGAVPTAAQLTSFKAQAAAVRSLCTSSDSAFAFVESLGDDALAVVAETQLSLGKVQSGAMTVLTQASSGIASARSMWGQVNKAAVVRSLLGDQIASITSALTAMTSVLPALSAAANSTLAINISSLSVHVAVLRQLSSARGAACSLSDGFDSLEAALQSVGDGVLLTVSDLTTVASEVDAAVAFSARISSGLSSDLVSAALSQLNAVIRFASSVSDLGSVAARTLRTTDASSALSSLLSSLGGLEAVQSALGAIGISGDDVTKMKLLISQVSNASLSFGDLRASFAELVNASAIIKGLQSARTSLSSVSDVRAKLLTSSSGGRRLQSGATLASSPLGTFLSDASGAVSKASAIATNLRTWQVQLSSNLTMALSQVAGASDAAFAQVAQRVCSLYIAPSVPVVVSAASFSHASFDELKAVAGTNFASAGGLLVPVRAMFSDIDGALLQAVATITPLLSTLTAIGPLHSLLGDAVDGITGAVSMVSSLGAFTQPLSSALDSGSAGIADAQRLLQHLATSEAQITSLVLRLNSSLSACSTFASSAGGDAAIRALNQSVLQPLQVVASDALSLTEKLSDSALGPALNAASAMASALDTAFQIADVIGTADVSASSDPSVAIVKLQNVMSRILPLVQQVADAILPDDIMQAAMDAISSAGPLSSVLDPAAVSKALTTTQKASSLLSDSKGLYNTYFASGSASSDGMISAMATSPAALNVADALLAKMGIDVDGIKAANSAGQRIYASGRNLWLIAQNLTSSSISTLFVSIFGLNSTIPRVKDLGQSLALAANQTGSVFARNVSTSMRFAAIKTLMGTISGIIDSLKDLKSQASSLTDFQALWAKVTGIFSLGNIADDAGVIIDLARKMQSTLASIGSRSGSGSTEVSIFDDVMRTLMPAEVQDAVSWVKGLWSSVTDALSFNIDLSEFDFLRDIVNSLRTVVATLTDFSALEDAISGIPFISSAKKSLDSVLTTVSSIGKTFGTAIKGGIDSVINLLTSLRSAYDTLSKATVGSVINALPLPSGIQDAMSAVTSYAPQALTLVDVADQLLSVVPSAGDNTTISGLLGGVTKLSGSDLAVVLKQMRRLPPVATFPVSIEQIASAFDTLTSALPRLTSLVDVAQSIASRAGASLDQLADASSLPFAFLTSGGVSSIAATVMSRLSPGIQSVLDTVIRGLDPLQKWNTELYDRDTAIEILGYIQSAAADIPALVSTSNAAFGDVASVLSSLGDVSNDIAPLLSIFAGFQGISDSAQAALAKTSAGFTSITDAVPALRAGLPAVDGIQSVLATASELIGTARSIGVFASSQLSSAADISSNGALRAASSVEYQLLSLRSTMTTVISAYTSMINSANSSSSDVAYLVAAASDSLLDVTDTLRAINDQLSDVSALTSALSTATDITVQVIAAAQVVEDISDAATSGTPVSNVLRQASSFLASLKSSLPSGAANVLSVVDDVMSLQQTLSDAGQIYWAVRAANLSAITGTLSSLSSQASSLRGLLP